VIVAISAGLVVFSTGCGGEADAPTSGAETEDSNSSSPETVRQTQLIEQAQLADAVDMAAEEGARAKSNSCVGVKDYTLENVGNWNAKAFYTYNMQDVYREIDVKVDGGVNMEDLGVTGAWDYYYEDTSTNKKEVLSLVAHVQTVKQSFQPGGGDGAPKEDHCQFNGYDQNATGLENFRSVCGTGFISQETMGGYVVLTARLNSLSSEVKEKVDLSLNANAGPIDGGLTGAINAVDSIDNVNLEFRVQTEGIPAPSSNLINFKNNGKYIPASDVLQYISEVNQGYQSVLNDTSKPTEDKLWSAEFGQVINESYMPYNADTLMECGFEDTSQDLICYTDTMDKFHKFSEDRESYVRTLRRAQWVQDNKNSDRVRWADNHNADSVSTSDLIGQLEACTQGEAIQKVKESCQDIYRNANFEQLCSACQIPEDCKPGTINENIRKWEDDFEILPPDPTTVPVELKSASAPSPGDTKIGPHSDDWVCTLSKVQGGFFGGGESLKVTKNVNGYWQLDQETARTDDDEVNEGTMSCVKHTNFFTQEDGGGDTGVDGGSGCGIDASSCSASWSQQTFTVKSTGSLQDRRLLEDKYAAALTGVKGNFGGYGERVRINQFRPKDDTSTADSWLTVKTAANFLRGRAVSFGVDNPAPRSQPRKRTMFNAESTLRRAEALGHTDDKYCYLTRVTGEFDGPTERARVYRDGTQWILSARSACKKNKGVLGLGPKCKDWKKMRATARCYEYDQSD